jgi:chemotaxis response regulator CheB
MARILIADDSASFRALAGRLVRDGGHVVVGEAEDAASALRLARTLAPDAVLLDVHLGADDGWAVAEVLGERCAARVVMVSSDPDAADDELVRRGRASAFVAKGELAAVDLAAVLGRP